MSKCLSDLPRKDEIKILMKEISISSSEEISALVEYWVCEGNKFSSNPYKKNQLNKVI